MIKYLNSSIYIAIFGLGLAMFSQYYQSGSMALVLQAGLTALILAVLEISLSLDNAVVNATVIKKMDDVWKHRFLTWGMLIAVFGMRLVFPLIIVAIIAHINPFEALQLALTDQARYAEIMTSAHLTIVSFGGIFLFMVFLSFFINEEREDYWIPWIEKPLKKLIQFEGSQTVLTLLLILAVVSFAKDEDKIRMLIPSLYGMITFLLVHGLSAWLDQGQKSSHLVQGSKVVASSGFGLFLYLEILDASFSFDGVIGAFAITQNLIQIMIGLSIGAFFVRSLTLYLVDNETLNQFRYLEHGAFYALGVLAFMMMADYFFHVPEWVTGLAGAAILATSIVYSMVVQHKLK